MNHRQQANLMGYTPKYMWEACKLEWIDEQIDIHTGRKQSRMAVTRLRRIMTIEVGRALKPLLELISKHIPCKKT